jgi:hypothetical protein
LACESLVSLIASHGFALAARWAAVGLTAARGLVIRDPTVVELLLTLGPAALTSWGPNPRQTATTIVTMLRIALICLPPGPDPLWRSGGVIIGVDPCAGKT